MTQRTYPMHLCREATMQNVGINGSHPVLNLHKINRKESA